MKKVFSALFFTVLVITCFAQVKPDSTKHLTFKGVPIDGKLNEFVLKMREGGFTNTGTEDGTAILQGDFASYKSCTIGVSTLKPKDLVSKIAVLFPERDSWSSLSSNYFDLKEMLTEKYGKPSDCVETFQSTVQLEDNRKIFEVKVDRCKYLTTYKTEKGTIQLSIEHDNLRRCFVKLAYFDKINSEAVKKQALDDL